MGQAPELSLSVLEQAERETEPERRTEEEQRPEDVLCEAGLALALRSRKPLVSGGPQRRS